MTTQTSNPLLLKQEFAAYSQIQAEHIVPAVKDAVARSEAKLKELLSVIELDDKDEIASIDESKLTFDYCFMAFEEMEEYLDDVWTPIENMLSLVADDEFRDAAEEARPLVVEFSNEYSLDPRVYKLIKAYSETDEAKSLTGERKRHLENTLKDFKLSGAELEGEAKKEFKQLNLELSQLCQKFSNNATDSKFTVVITDESVLAGLPDDIKSLAQARLEEFKAYQGEEFKKHRIHSFDGSDFSELSEQDFATLKQAWIFNLDFPSYGPVSKFADNQILRHRLYIEYLSQASDKFGDKNNEPLIAKIFAAKTRKAQLLGFKNYAEASIEAKMAESVAQVQEFLENIATKSKPLADKDYAALVKFQKEIGYSNLENNPDKICSWDNSYLSEKLRQKEYNFDTNLLKPYFELGACIKGMLDISRTLFGVDFKALTKDEAKAEGIELWHQEVVPYQVIVDGKFAALFYMDLYPRDTKRQGAWMMPLVQGEELREGGYRRPQCTLVCNLTKATADTPSLLTHMELTTLFHEFGHSLHHLLTTAKLSALAGTSVDWDFVELPSQLLENFCWERESLNTFAKHYKTGDNIPEELLDNLLKSRNFNEGLACTRQVEFGLFDFAIYTRAEDDGRSPNEIYKSITDKYGVFPVVEGTNFPCSFGHIFAGGYSAGYYSYKWAEVLEADAFSRFQKEGVLNPEVGKAYRETILAQGDTKPAMDIFKEFMGREPNENALLERMGL